MADMWMRAGTVKPKSVGGWNYRVIEFVDPTTEEPWRGIFEVYYDAEGRPNGYIEDPSDVVSYDSGGNEAPGGLAWVLDKMREALTKPVLVEKDFYREGTGNPNG